jgi:hypothetical protein
MFLETAAWPHMREARAKINEQARTGYSKCNAYSQGIYLAWTSKLDLYLEAIESIFVQSKSGKVVNDITDILRANDWSTSCSRTPEATLRGSGIGSFT